MGGPRKGRHAQDLESRARATVAAWLIWVAVAASSPAGAAELFGPARLRFAVGTSPADLVLGDFNGDEATDLAVASSGGNTVSLLLGDGRGSFGDATHVAV